MVGAKTPPGDPPAGPQRIRGPSNMSSGGPKLKSSHPCRNSAVDGLPSTTRAAAQTWSTTREKRIGDTRDRFEALSDTPRVPQPRGRHRPSQAKKREVTFRDESGRTPYAQIHFGDSEFIFDVLGTV